MTRQQPARRPNVLVIVTDHHAFYGHDGSSGRSDGSFAMPTFAAFADDGVRFDRAYCVSPICTPARASMWTGQYPSSHGLRWNTDGVDPGRRSEFRPGQRLYSHHLAEAGYRNAFVGKWHCGSQRLPVDYGIEGWSLPDYGNLYDSPEYRAHARRYGVAEPTARIEYAPRHPEWEGRTMAVHDTSPWTYMDLAGVLDGPPEVHEAQFVATTAAAKLRELTAAARRTGQPWSLVASFWGPHHPYLPSEPFASMVDPAAIPPYPSFTDGYGGNRPMRSFLQRDLRHGTAQRWPDWSDWQRILARVRGQTLQTDAAIAGLLDLLSAEGVADDTLVVWTADHGDLVASHGGLWDKGSTYGEEVARVPLALRWPGGFAGGRRSTVPVTNMDLTATVLAAAGVTPPAGMHSRSLLDECRGTGNLPDHVVTEHHGHGEDLLLRAVLTGRYKYVAAVYDGDELYDLDADPYELRNLADEPEHAPTARRLRGLLVDHLDRIGDTGARRLRYALTRDR
jgi:arylsulfatase A-like enzyme